MSKKMIAVMILLLAVTGIVIAIHLANQQQIACMVIQQEDHQIAVSFEDLDKASFSGELIDGKGDTTFHQYTGVLLRELLEHKGIDLARISIVTVTSADNYSAEFTVDEILQEDKVYVAITVDETKVEGIDPGSDGVQVVVFEDPNSRRCVRFAQRITVE